MPAIAVYPGANPFEVTAAMITMALFNGGRHDHSTGKSDYRAARERSRLKMQLKTPQSGLAGRTDKILRLIPK